MKVALKTFILIAVVFSNCKPYYLRNNKEIDLSDKNINEVDYSRILKYPDLEKLDLSDNSLKKFPDSLYLLPNLKTLLLSRNIIDSVPKSINKFNSLRVLDLKGNNVSYFPDMREMTNLEIILTDGRSVQFLEKLACSIPKTTKVIYNYELRPYTSIDCPNLDNDN